MLLIRQSKFAKSRYVPLHASTVDALRDYADRRDEFHPLPGNNAFFVRTDVPGDFPAPERVLRRGPNHWLRGEALQPDPEGRAYVDLDDAAPSP